MTIKFNKYKNRIISRQSLEQRFCIRVFFSLIYLFGVGEEYRVHIVIN